jgi:hypothetical protein
MAFVETINRRNFGRFGQFQTNSKGFCIVYISLGPGVFAVRHGYT